MRLETIIRAASGDGTIERFVRPMQLVSILPSHIMLTFLQLCFHSPVSIYVNGHQLRTINPAVMQV